MGITKVSGNLLVSDERIYADKDGNLIRGVGTKIPANAKTVVAEPGQPLSAAFAAKYRLVADAEPTPAAPAAPAAKPAPGADRVAGGPDTTEPLVGKVDEKAAPKTEDKAAAKTEDKGGRR